MTETSDLSLAAFDRLVFRPKADGAIWQQIYDHILHLIEDGSLLPGAQLPGETHIASTLGVTRMTLRRALQQLQTEGHLTARKGVGIFVRNPPAIFCVRDGRPFRDNINTHSAPVTTQTRLIATLRASAELAGRLRLEPGACVLHLRRVRLVDGLPVYMNDKYFPQARFPRFKDVYAWRESVTDVFQAHGIAAFRRAETRVSGSFCTGEQARILQLTPGTPVFRIHSRNEDDDAQTIEWTAGCWPLTSVEFVFGETPVSGEAD